MSIQDNIANYNRALTEVKNHCMCFKTNEECHKMTVIFPYPVRGISGIRFDKTAKGFMQAVDLLEKACKRAIHAVQMWILFNCVTHSNIMHQSTHCLHSSNHKMKTYHNRPMVKGVYYESHSYKIRLLR